jgi:hypothetical protein
VDVLCATETASGYVRVGCIHFVMSLVSPFGRHVTGLWAATCDNKEITAPR